MCVVPVGWKRESVQGRIVYISPSQSLLWSHSDLLSYLTMDGTCKCGLACPLYLDKVFNFDPACGLQRYANLNDSDTNQNNLCNQHRKLQALAHYRSMLKGDTDQGQQPDSPLHQQPHHHLHQQQQQQQPQQLIRRHSPNGYDRSLHHRQQLQIETRSPRVHSLIQNPQPPLNSHDASQHLVVNPREVNGRELVTSYVNGNDTHAQQQQHHHHHQQQPHPHPHHLQHVNHSPPDSRQLHDVTAVTASITELIPSVGQLVPQMQIHQQAHHPAHVQYSLILPQQILTMQPSADAQHMLLSPQIVSSFPNHTITSPFHQQHHFTHPPHQLVYETQSNTADLMKQRARQRKRGNKKVRTVAAILNLTT